MTKLTALKVKTTTQIGMHSDGGGLHLKVQKSKDGSSLNKSWIYRWGAQGRNLYMRYTTITEVTDAKQSSSVKSLDSSLVQRMEDANKWWVEKNKLSVLVLNPTKSELKEVVFELSTTDCKTENGKKRLLSLPLHVNLEANNSAIYSGQLPFNYDKLIGNGMRCGLIKAALN